MMWFVREIITHLSRVPTIGRGTAILSSTLFGAGYLGMGFSQVIGDTVQTEIEVSCRPISPWFGEYNLEIE